MKKTAIKLFAFSALILLCNPGFAQAPAWSWAERMGGSNHDLTIGVGADASNRVYTISWGGSTVINYGSTTEPGPGMVLAKYNSVNGVLFWTETYGTASTIPQEMSTDAAGNCYIAGLFYDSIFQLGSYTLVNSDPGYGDIFLFKTDNNGTVLWARSIQGPDNDQLMDLFVDKSGNPYLIGTANSPAVVDTVTRDSALTFVAKYDTNGNFRFVHTRWEYPGNVTADNSGNVYFSGADFIAGPQILKVTKLDSSGNVVWSNSMGGYVSHYQGIGCDESGNVYVSGRVLNVNVTFGATTLFSQGGYDPYLVKVLSNGTVGWAVQIASDDDDYITGVVTDSLGNSIIAGGFQGTSLSVAPWTLNQQQNSDNVFVACIDNQGTCYWAQKSVGGGQRTDCYDHCVDQNGGIYLGGSYGSISGIDFGTITLNLYAVNFSDGFVACIYNQTAIEQEGMIEPSLTVRQAADGSTSIKFMDEPGDYVFRITDVLGRTILEQSIEPGIEIVVPISVGAPYFVSVFNSNGNVRASKKFISFN